MMVRYEKEGKETYDYGKIECLLISQDSISYGKIKSQYPLTKLIITEIFKRKKRYLLLYHLLNIIIH